ncbi:ubiquinone biosynthesis accessory factor UbiJ [Arenicella xantha]|uniref:Ubiquinone biosynthesis accessory factor UbiJ n=1 Tax=Arenicella xantha TaxID=644221 RepID=A0A395JPQ6_9GAMM|nr:SCP2 sterol-binding domain-containing protein [Arenicella xantha]RBP53624.1 ubiquinone biosynthesis protein UbiJ [Arenicella xantha]
MLFELLELAGNKTLEFDQATKIRLTKLQGKTMMLRIKPIDQTISVTPQREGLEFSRSSVEPVDVTLTATIGAMLKISRDGLADADLAPGELEISGDPIVGQRFAQVLAELDIDWESLLAEQFGESSARMMTYLAGEAKNAVEDGRSRFKQFLNETLTGKDGVVADAPSVHSFMDDVDSLRASVDRLASRLNKLNAKR